MAGVLDLVRRRVESTRAEFEDVTREAAALLAKVATLEDQAAALRETLVVQEAALGLIEDAQEELGQQVEVAPSSGSRQHSPPPATNKGSRHLAMEEAVERILALLSTSGRAMKVQEIAKEIGEDVSEARRVETTRSRLKRLVQLGQVVEGPVAWFSLAAPESGEAQRVF
jgi:hypothetical protein